MTSPTNTLNHLYYGDNLVVLREYIANESVDLVYLDPPFNSKATYNVLFKGALGEKSQAQIEAFEDTWHWNDSAETAFDEVMQYGNTNVAEMLRSLRMFLRENDMMAYITMMAVRLLELHRILKPTGSIYLHCDPTASHYLKILLDAVFTPKQFRNEIIWRRTGAHNKMRRFGPIHDVILFYTKTDNYKWRYPKRPFMKGHVEENCVKDDIGWKTDYYGNVLTGSGTRQGKSGKPWRGYDPTAKGRHWAIPGALLDDLDEDISHLDSLEKLEYFYQKGWIKITPGEAWPVYERYLKPSDGQAVSDIWAYQPYTNNMVFGTDQGIDEDVRWLSPKDQERLGYPTQKPSSLLKRIIQASTDVDDIVLDPFCGCGTTIHTAQKLNRQWIGIDVTHLAISLIEKRLCDAFPGIKFEVHGTPQDLEGARALALQDKYQFQWWAVSLVNAVPFGGKKKGADGGIDGHIYFKPDGKTTATAIVSVKGGNIDVSMIRDLGHVIDREKAKIGIFITLKEPTKPMNIEAVKTGFFETGFGKYPKIQILTIADLLAGKKPLIPLIDPNVFKKAAIEVKEDQQSFF